MTSALKILPLVMLLVGCNFQHYPLSRPEDAKIDLRLAGVWRGELEEPDTPDEEPQTMYLAFIPFNERSFLVWGGKNIEKPYDLEGWEKHMSGRAFTTKIDGQLYLNMQLLSPAYVLNPTREQTDDVPDDGALAQLKNTGILPLYGLAKIELDGDTLRLIMFGGPELKFEDDSALARLCEQDEKFDSIEAKREFVLAHPERFSEVQTYHWVPRPKE